MASHLSDDAEYPYTARYVAPPNSITATEPPVITAPASGVKWRAVVRWSVRLVISLSLLLILVAGAVGLFGYRTIERAFLAGGLEARDCNLVYVHQLPGETDRLPPLVRKAVGDSVFSEIAEVSHTQSFFGYGPNDNKAEAICQLCRKLDKLRGLTIVSDSFSFDMIMDLPQLDQLEHLELNSAKLTDADLASISQMRALKTLKLTSSNITSGAIGQLAALPRLQRLELCGIRKTASPAIPAGRFASLERLVIEQTQIDDELILSLGELPRLQEVTLTSARISDRGLKHLLGGGNVTTILVNDAGETDVDNAAAFRCPGPAVVHLADLAISDEGLNSLAGSAPSALVLDRTQITDEGLRVVGQLKGLRYLSLRQTSVNGTGAKHLAAVSSLEQLDMRGAAVTTEGAAALAQIGASQLILSMTGLNDEGLQQFADNDKLRELEILGTRVTAAGVRQFYEARKQRLAAKGRRESLVLTSDFPDVVGNYVNLDSMMPGMAGGMPGSPPPDAGF
jgi:hypothetical protein